MINALQQHIKTYKASLLLSGRPGLSVLPLYVPYMRTSVSRHISDESGGRGPPWESCFGNIYLCFVCKLLCQLFLK